MRIVCPGFGRVAARAIWVATLALCTTPTHANRVCETQDSGFLAKILNKAKDAVGLSADPQVPLKRDLYKAEGPALNNIETLHSDMSELNDLPLKGVNPKYGFARGPGHVVMANDPRGTHTPDWYKDSYPQHVTDAYWNYILPWFVFFEGQDNSATNTRIEFRNLKLFMKSRTSDTWRLINQQDHVAGTQCPQGSNYFHCTLAGRICSESASSFSAMPVPVHNLHGWWGKREPINGQDIAAIFVTMQARLITNNHQKPDDRDQARYLVQVGADYYPSDSSAKLVLPGVGVSRAKLLSSQWQSISMTTMSDVGVQEPGGGITSAQLRVAPPPLD